MVSILSQRLRWKKWSRPGSNCAVCRFQVSGVRCQETEALNSDPSCETLE
ncbi:hypothetical protein D1AOALGA4SA_2834 [Olavius algarvensis Delta 1 endosymbiont]|nr:hypothetical protein D1AOALGA4SA_2834 [Olavius algarvensis Delta 1 endosymbiont]